MRNATCGSEPAREYVGSGSIELDDPALSRAGSLPQGGVHWLEIRARHPTVGFHTIGKVFVYSEKVGVKASQP